MASSFSSFCLLLCISFITQCTNTNCARDDYDLLKDPRVRVFFKAEDLKVGDRLPLYFQAKSPYKFTPFLPKEKADSIPFSSKHLPQLLDLFNFSATSAQGRSMAYTLKSCERKSVPGETKFCATSLESLLDSVRSVLGSEADIDVLATKLSPTHKIDLQNYTVVAEPKVVETPKVLGCHVLPYPYKVYFCHSQVKDRKVSKVSLVGDDGERVEGVTISHADTNLWRRDNIAFTVLNTQPGKSVVSHFIPADNFVWVVSPTTK